MATSLIAALRNQGIAAENVWVYDKFPVQTERLQSQYGITAITELNSQLGDCAAVVLAVKPQQLKEVCMALAAANVGPAPLYLSIAAGVRSDAINGWLGGHVAVVRSMPNTPALVGCGMTGLYRAPSVSDEQAALAESLLKGAGQTLWVENEDQIDAITAISGSGPAYYFAFTEALQKAALNLGFSDEQAELLANQTALGAAKMLVEDAADASTLRERVTSPGGTTEQALKVFQAAQLDQLVDQAANAAKIRSAELADQFS